MIKCLVCGAEKADGRSMHGHMVRCHYDEYKEKGWDLEELTEGYKRTKSNVLLRERKMEKVSKPDPAHQNEKPENLRLLNKSNQEEFQAYNEGFRYFDPDEKIAYTKEEVKEEGWI